MKIETFTGGVAATNAYYLHEGRLLIDAPEGAAEHAREHDWKIETLLLTHGHFDHIWDAAAIQKTFGCPVLVHADDERLLTEEGIWRKHGFPIDLPPVRASRFVRDGEELEFGPWRFRALHAPGHCLGSLCFYDEKAAVVFGGDVLFQGGVGRWDLPGGDHATLLKSIADKLLVLPDNVRVFPGHGPATTIGQERHGNPYLPE